MTDPLEFDPVEWITASSIGPPGGRTFYIQARKDGVYVSFVVEKGQVRSLAELAQDLLARVEVTVTPDDVNSDLELHGPVQPLWRAGQMSLGSNEEGERFVLEIEELPGEDSGPEPAVARFVMDLDTMVRLAAFAAFAVEHGGRERCQVCEGLRDPMAGCMGCPLTNGSGPKRI
ncbi:MAG TPA: DUF3090 family protein [Euzebya sp.]|nr:DUF3090 family protein [Euzebya sp.]